MVTHRSTAIARRIADSLAYRVPLMTLRFAAAIRVLVDGAPPGACPWAERHRRVMRGYTYDAIARQVPAIGFDSDGVRFYLRTADPVMARTMFVEGNLGLSEMRYGLKALAALRKPSWSLAGRAFVDIGANIGTSSLYAIRLFGASSAVAFEPDPENFFFLQLNVAANQESDRVRALQYAVSRADGDISLALSPINPGDHRVMIDSTARAASEGREVVRAPAVSFDSAVAAGYIDLEQVGLVWIDGQGHDAHVLAGARTLLDSDIPVIVEFWPFGLRLAGGLSLFEQLVRDHYRHFVDLRACQRTGDLIVRGTDEITSLADAYPGHSYTDLILVD